jgi:hypothetical protein
MQRIAVVAIVCLAGLLSPASRAQSPPTTPATQKGFSFCSIHDTAGRTVWASPVFEYEYPSGDSGSRTSEMATDFHDFIGSMGGAGDKNCASADADRAAVEAFRNEQRSILTQRFMGVVRANAWLDVAWTPKPWAPVLMAKPAVVSKHFYCYGTDTDQGNVRAASVASPVFEASMDGTDPMAPYTLAEEYGKEFTRYVVDVQGLTQANPSCYFKDTRAEADKALRDYRRMFSGFNLKFADVAWRPTGKSSAPPSAPASTAPPTATGSMLSPVPVAVSSAVPATQGRIGVRFAEVTPELALGLGMETARGALVIEVQKDSPAMAAGLKPMDVVLGINQQAVEQATDLPVISHRLPAGKPASLRVWRERAEHQLLVHVAGSPTAAAVAQAGAIAAPNAAPSSMAADASVQAVARRKYCHAFIQRVGKPGGVHSTVWENSGSDGSQAAMATTLTAFAAHARQLQSTTWHDFTASAVQCDMNVGFCFATSLRHFGASQIAGQFCKDTREEAEADWTRLSELDRAMEAVAWPAAR